MIKPGKVNEKLHSAIHDIELNKEASDDDLKIDLEFLMSEESCDSANEEVIAEKIKTELSKSKKLNI